MLKPSVGDGSVKLWRVTPSACLMSLSLHAHAFLASLASVEVACLKQPYISRTVHFLDQGKRLIVTYLERREM